MTYTKRVFNLFNLFLIKGKTYSSDFSCSSLVTAEFRLPQYSSIKKRLGILSMASFTLEHNRRNQSQFWHDTPPTRTLPVLRVMEVGPVNPCPPRIGGWPTSTNKWGSWVAVWAKDQWWGHRVWGRGSQGQRNAKEASQGNVCLYPSSVTPRHQVWSPHSQNEYILQSLDEANSFSL